MTDAMPGNRDQDRERTGGLADRYNMLPLKTREAIENWHDDDLDNLNSLMVLMRKKGVDSIQKGIEMSEAASTMGRWSWKVVAAVTAMFLGVTGLLQALQWWKSPGGHP